MKFALRSSVTLTFGLIACLCLAETAAVGQGFGPRRTSNRDDNNRGPSNRSGFGRRGGFGPSVYGSSIVVGALYRAETRDELGLSNTEMRELQEAAHQAITSNSTDIRAIFNKIRNAGSDEEREAIRQEIRDSLAEQSGKAEEAIEKSIGAEKMLRLKQLALQYEGGRALMRDDVAADLNITDAQKAKLAELRNQWNEARRELGFRASVEERASLDKEWDDKLFSVLTDEQRAKWAEKVGRIVKPTGRTVGRAGAGGSGGASASSGRGRGAPSSVSFPVFGSNGVVRALYRVETRVELGLSDDEIRKLQEAVREAMAFSSTDQREIFNKMRTARSNEERDKIQKDLRDASAERNQKAEEVIAKVIGAEKMLRLKQLALQYEGGRALLRDDVSGDLKLTEAQIGKLTELMNQRNQARRETGFRASQEERASFEKEWDDKYFSILTDEQRAEWKQKLGRIVKQTGGTAGFRRPTPSQITGRSNTRFPSGASGRRGFGVSSIGGSSVVGALSRAETRDDLGLSDDELQKLQEAAREALSSSSIDTRALFEKMRNAGSDEERERIRKEAQDAFAERNKKAEEAIATAIGAEKMLRLKQLALQYEGVRALLRSEFVADLKIGDAQKGKLVELINQRSEARRKLGSRASPEERASLDKEWDDKILSILTDEQRAQWAQKLGRIVKQTGQTVTVGRAEGSNGVERFFDYTDRNRDGKLDQDEIRRIPSIFRKSFERQGVRLDGGISRDQFVRAMPQAMEEMRRQRDRDRSIDDARRRSISSSFIRGRPVFVSHGVLGALYRAETLDELGLSDDELLELQQVAHDGIPTSSTNTYLSVLTDTMRRAGSGKERDKVLQQIRDAVALRTQKCEEAIEEKIGAEKMLRLKQLSLQYEGSRALLRKDIAAELHITDAQQEKFEESMRLRDDARRRMGFRDYAMKRASFDKEWDDKFFSILTPEQRRMWDEKVGHLVKQTGLMVGVSRARSSRSISGSNAWFRSGIGLVEALNRVETRVELRLSADQIRELKETASEAMSSGSADTQVLFDKMRNAESDEERDQIGEQIRDAYAERNKTGVEAIAKLIGAEKMQRLEQLALQYEGVRALLRDDVADDLFITDEQKAQLAEMIDERNEAGGEFGGEASPEERATFDKEWDEKIFSILTPVQRTAWNRKVGRTITVRGRRARPGNQ